MASRANTTPERLTRIETLLEANLPQIVERLEKIEGHQIKQDELAALDKAELEKLKNRGFGLLVGAGLAGGAFWEGVKMLFAGAMK
jgi:hypothetical protein